jgi:hypothetical protein
MNNKDTFNLMAFELTDSDKLLSGSSSSTVGLPQRSVLHSIYVFIFIYTVHTCIVRMYA